VKDLVEKNPGIRVAQIVELSGLTIAQVEYAIRCMRNRGFLVSRATLADMRLHRYTINPLIPKEQLIKYLKL
jgi:hypothetical protein